jgi:hypothetical protein
VITNIDKEYTGQLFDDKMHGNGYLKLKNGTEYKGEFEFN